jgi:hypothetical protein
MMVPANFLGSRVVITEKRYFVWRGITNPGLILAIAHLGDDARYAS